MTSADKEELLRVLDADGNFIGEYKNRSEVHKDKLFHNEVALWIIDKNNKKILLQRRNKNKLSNPNKLAICAGHVVEDETIQEALFKEAQEELGLDLKRYKFKRLITIKKESPKNYCFSHHFYIIAQIPISDFKIQEEELSEVLYMDYDELLARVKNGDEEVVFKWNETYKIVFDMITKIILD